MELATCENRGLVSTQFNIQKEPKVQTEDYNDVVVHRETFTPHHKQTQTNKQTNKPSHGAEKHMA